MPAPRTLEETYQHHADRRGPDECWPWMGCRNSNGYGYICLPRGSGRRYIRATHVAWSVANGQPWPEGKWALHSCDNPSCVNPGHLRPGTALDNVRDMIDRGRARFSTPPRGGGQRRVACKRGHEFTPENTILAKTGKRAGKRLCRICRRASWRRDIRKLRLASLSARAGEEVAR